ncbi:MAG TPA: YciI family protein [Armatimonadota bacterium]|nr:YciI family protein [Armatimonadota bacterium]
MRFMMLIYPGEQAESGALPDEAQIAAMMKFNEEMAQAGVLIGLDGLQPSSKGARVRFSDGKPTVTDGPFTEAKELLGGYWVIQVNSKEEAVGWARRCPSVGGASNWMIEVRQMFETSDFGVDPASDLGAEMERVAESLGAKGP